MCLLTSVTPTEALTSEHCTAHTPLVQKVCGDSQESFNLSTRPQVKSQAHRFSHAEFCCEVGSDGLISLRY